LHAAPRHDPGHDPAAPRRTGPHHPRRDVTGYRPAACRVEGPGLRPRPPARPRRRSAGRAPAAAGRQRDPPAAQRIAALGHRPGLRARTARRPRPLPLATDETVSTPEPGHPSTVTALMLQITAHAERLAALDQREADRGKAVTGQLGQLAAQLTETR